ncbi:MAG: methyl-accepting chemotaxis protein [Stenotrophomonas maltophilia]
MKLNHLKISHRLSLGFGLLILFLIGLATQAISQLSAMHAGTQLIVTQRYPIIRFASEVHGDIGRASVAMHRLLLNEDAGQSRVALEELARIDQQIGKNLAAIGSSVRTDKGKALQKTIEEARDSYNAKRDRFLQMLRAGDKAGATALLGGALYQDQLAFQGHVFKHVDLGGKLLAAGWEASAKTYDDSRLILGSLAAAAVLLALVFSVWITRGITRPLGHALRLARAVAAGDLTLRIEAHGQDETGQLMRALKDMNESLARIVSQVRGGTNAITQTSSEIAAGSQDLSGRTEQQAAAMEETLSSMAELSSTVRQNADNARQANQLAEQASSVAERGGQAVSDVVHTMTSISESSRRIVDIIGVIDAIAFQTNILALNAAVEAARAGEQGRGFAVVASEVRGLAQRSAAAAKEIKELIGDSVNKVESGSKLVNQAGATMNETVASVRRVADIVSEILSASGEQASGIDQIHQAISQVDQVTQQNAALVEESTAASEAMRMQATSLAHAVSVFRLDAGAAPAPAGPTTTTRAPARTPARPALAQAPRLDKTAPVARSEGSWEEF